MSLINREELLTSIMDDNGLQYPRWWYVEKVKNAPEAVTHCKDCILHGVCAYERGLGANGFCNQGNRREDE